jgi:hypothetical protein
MTVGYQPHCTEFIFCHEWGGVLLSHTPCSSHIAATSLCGSQQPTAFQSSTADHHLEFWDCWPLPVAQFWQRWSPCCTSLQLLQCVWAGLPSQHTFNDRSETLTIAREKGFFQGLFITALGTSWTLCSSSSVQSLPSVHLFSKGSEILNKL